MSKMSNFELPKYILSLFPRVAFSIIFSVILINEITYSQWNIIYQTSSSYYGFYSDISFVSQNTGYVACRDSAMLKTTNGGLNWQQLNGTGNLNIELLQFTSVNTGYAIGNVYFSNAHFLKTTDAGNNWLVQNLNYNYRQIKFLSDSVGYILSDTCFVYKTTNGGQSWAQQNLVYSLLESMEFVDINNGYVSGYAGHFFTTTNGGANWIEHLFYPTFTRLQFLNLNTAYGIEFSSNNSKVYKTSNAGMSWTMIFNLDSTYVTTLFFIDENRGWIGGGRLQNGSVFKRIVYKTLNGGQQWYEQATGYQSVDSSSNVAKLILIDTSSGFFITSTSGQNSLNGMIFKTTNGGGPIGIEPIGTLVPKNFMLYQNFPNPFNPSTKIEFSIPDGTQGNTTLKVFDLLGKEVAVILNERLRPGTYEVEWNASNYPSGVYFYTITTSSFRDTKKMILMK